jgi:HlyD family secretion protein
MDVARARRRFPKWLAPAVGLVVLAALTTWALGSFSNTKAKTVVDRATLVTDTARRGSLVLSVGAQGAFAPEYVRVISVQESGVVNRIFVKAGSVVAPGTVVAQMQNPALTAAAADAAAGLRVANASLAGARQEAQAAVITQQTQEADAQAGHAQDALQAASLAKLHSQGLISDIAYHTAEIQARKSANDLRSTHAQVAVAAADAGAKIAAAQAKVDQAAAQLAADEAAVAALTVRSATAGVVQSVDVDPGATVTQGGEIARVADLHDLKAVLHVAESDVKSVAVGMPARIDDGNGVARGRVARIAPAADSGTVAVDVTFPAAAPPGARPAANVDGVIEIARIRNALSIARPAAASDGRSIDVFKVIDNGTRAVRTHLTLGRGSNDRIQVLNGLRAGDTVIVSDMTPYLDKTELQLH